MTDLPIKGLDETIAVLSSLPKTIQKSAVRKGLTRAAGVVRDEARFRAPKKTGKLEKAIKSGSSRHNQDGTFSVRVYVDERRPHGFLGYFFEYGIDPHYIAPGSYTDGGEAQSGRQLNLAIRRREDVTSETDSKKLKIGNQLVSGAVMHPGVAARPFMRPALDIKADEAVRALAFEIEEVVFNYTGFQTAG